MMRADLHIHTYYSDGMLTPVEVVEFANKAGLQLISVTDHDNMNGSDEVKKLATDAGIVAIDGIEISSYDEGKVHVLGYNLNKHCSAYKKFYKKTYDASFDRCRDILDKLAKHGVRISMDEVLKERRCPTSPVHSMYISRAAARKGYGNSPIDFYLKYIGHGTCGYSFLGRPSPYEAVTVIKECGGFSSLAHPGRIFMDADKKVALIQKLKDCGLDGIEAVYSGHNDSETAYYKEIATSFNLLVTGGSDTHYSFGSKSIGTPEFYPSQELLNALKTH